MVLVTIDMQGENSLYLVAAKRIELVQIHKRERNHIIMSFLMNAVGNRYRHLVARVT
jgi:hypothetical protein